MSSGRKGNGYKKKKKGVVFQASAFFQNMIFFHYLTEAKRISPASSKTKYVRASMTVEAALVLPLFLFVSLMILSLIDMMDSYMVREKRLHGLVREGCMLKAVVAEGSLGQKDLLRLDSTYPVAPRVKGPGYKVFLLENHCVAHIFNGYDVSFGDRTGESEPYVYVTASGTAYHKRRSCSHLNVTIQAIEGEKLGGMRNQDGGKYYPCRYCASHRSKDRLSGSTIYVADYGSKYHTSITCSELKRIVRVIPLSQAGGYSPCRTCAGS